MAKKKNKKIVRYRKPLNINVGMIIFACIFVYLVFSVYTYLSKEKVQFYEVVEGGIVADRNYTGFILREETTKYTDRAGNINYYVREGKRASLGSRVYSIDETGQLSQFLENSQGQEIGFTKENLADLKKQLSTYSVLYRDTDFSTVGDTKLTLQGSILEYVNFNMMGNLETAMNESGINFQQVRSDQPGIISYAVDGYEGTDETQISQELFDRSKYAKKTVQSGQLIAKDAPAYKLITSEYWSIVFPLSEGDQELYKERTSLSIRFKGRDLIATGDFSIITGTDSTSYGQLDFSKYMVQFVSDRYLDFEVIMDKENGLKIPTSAVGKKDFYTVPVAYLTQGGDDSAYGFIKESYSEAGTSTVFVPVTVYNTTDEYCYIGMDGKEGIVEGDNLVKPDSDERFKVGPYASLEGVYNINKGYAVFKQIQVLSSNGEYYIVARNTTYGLSVYDHIVLDAATTTEGDLIYQ